MVGSKKAKKTQDVINRIILCFANALKFYESISRRPEKGKKNSDISGSYARSKKHLAIVFVSDTIPSPFFLSSLWRQTRKIENLRAGLPLDLN